MKIATFASPQAIVEESTTLRPRFVVVIDTLRATSVITTALSNGAREVIPVMEIEEAVRLYQRLGGERTLLCGEREGNPIAGFHMGNSLGEYANKAVANKTLIMSTTNGTRAIHAAANAKQLAVGCLLNAAAVAEHARRSGLDVAIVCAGTRGRFTLEDVLTAGAIIARIGADNAAMDDLSALSHELYLRHYGNLDSALQACEHARYLIGAGYGEDVRQCMQTDQLNVVPYFEKGVVKI